MASDREIRAGIYAEAGAHVVVEQLVLGQAAVTLEPSSLAITDTESVVEALRPGAAVVPVGPESDDLLAALVAWRDGPRPHDVAILRGAAGSGKTRIAGELVSRSRDVGWLAGFVGFSHAGAVVKASGDALLVIDYAEATPSAVIGVLKAIHDARTEWRTRLLLLIRAPRRTQVIVDELLALAGSANDRDDIRRDLRQATEYSFAGEFALTLSACADLYQRATAAFARLDSLAGGRVPVMSVPPSIGRAPFTTPLMVTATALVNLLGGDAAAERTTTQVLDEVLAHERRFWARRVQETGVVIEPSRRDLAGAVFTVAPGGDRAEAQALLRSLPGLADEALAPVRDLIAGWWLGTYPDPHGRVRPIEPDLVGERLVAAVLGEDGTGADVLLSVSDYASPAGRKALLRTLTRAAPESPLLAQRLLQLLESHLAAFIADVKDETQFVDRPEPVADTLTLAVAQVDEVAGADVAAAELTSQPRMADTPAPLRPLIAALARAGARALTESDAGRLAAALSLESTMTGLVGRPQDALDSALEAVRIRRALAAESPNEYEPSLAQALSSLSNRLAGVGRRPEALAAAEEAVAVMSRLVGGGRRSSRVDLGVGLNTLAAARAAAGRDVDALGAAERAVAVFKELSEEEGGDVYLGDYSMTLTTLASRLNNEGKFPEARESAELSIEIRRQLAETDPDLQEPNIALGLNNLAMIYSNLGLNEEAFAASSAAVETRRRLAQRAPDVHNLSLARALSTHGNRAGALGRADESAALTAEAVDVLDGLTLKRRTAILPDLAGALNNYSAALQRQKQHAEAIAPAERAIGCYEELLEEGADAHADSFAAGLRTLEAAYAGADRLDEAVAAGERELEIRERLAKLPSSLHQNQLGRCLTTLAEVVEANGDSQRAAQLRARADKVTT